MSKSLSRDDALEDISAWTSIEVVELLRKNGVEEACWKAAKKRQIDGDELLHLTEGKLALWKSDLTRPLIWNLWTFVEELKKYPEKYVQQHRQNQNQQIHQEEEEEKEKLQNQQNLVVIPQQTLPTTEQLQPHIENGTLSDTSPWDTDFEDEEEEEEEEEETKYTDPPPPPPPSTSTCPPVVNSGFRNSLRMFQENDRASMQLQAELKASTFSLSSRTDNNSNRPTCAPPTPESTYANSEPQPPPLPTSPVPENDDNNDDGTYYANCGWSDIQQSDESTYANEPESVQPKPNSSRLYSPEQQQQQKQQSSSLADKLRAQLALIGVKPTLVPKPDGLVGKKDEVILRGGEPRSSFLHKATKINGVVGVRNVVNGVNGIAKKTSPSESTTANSTSSSGHSSRPQSSSEESLRNLPKPPAAIRGFDLVANLPARPACDSDDDDDDEDQNPGSTSGCYDASYETFDQQIVEQNRARTPSVQSTEPIVIGHNSMENVYRPLSSDFNNEDDYELYESITESPEDRKLNKNAKNSPPKVPPPLPAKPPRSLTGSQTQLNKPDVKTERSIDRRSATLPSQTSILSPGCGNATRPLPPPPPERQSYYDRPWFHNLTRDQANRLIEERCSSRGQTPLDGYFLMRPSTKNPDNPMTLVLWYKDKVYNIPVRRRPDNRYALGTPKDKERSFESIDDIVPFFKSEDLVLSSGGQETGKTRLTETPSKQ